MRRLLFIAAIAAAAGVHGEVFKCTTAQGKVIYQDHECAAASKEKALQIEQFDKQKIARAREKLARELQQRQQLEAQRLEQQRQQRALQALEQQAASSRALVDETRLQTEAIEENTEAVQRDSNSIGNVYYYPLPQPRPPIHRPGPPSHPLPHPRPHPRPPHKQPRTPMKAYR